MLLALAQAALAQPWPAKPIRLVAPYAAGGPVDISARLVAARLQEALGQPVVVENRPGAGGNLGVELVAKSPPDGYTLVIGAIATHAINPTLMGSVPYDPLRDFRHIALLVQVPNVLVLNNEVPARNVPDLVALLRKNPGKLDFGSGSTGSTGHLAGELFKQMTGTFMVHIPYKGSAPATLDLIAGRVQLMFDNLASALPNIRAGKVRALAVTTLRRSSFLPELPTLEESGLKGFDMTTWWGVMAPAKTPQAVVERLNAEILKAIESGDTREKLRAMGSESPAIRTPEQFSAFVASELKTYSALVKRSGAKPD
ncbi:MAG TPA: tripartite tricarboxylate transporter substrate binding protein [Burkholderiales bacterium]|jgi:tripartite-type tricarboxylate transporter receptor subunit TctC|nr:tripartite tricarboxylate transporter substrate binding protein [Burkholderiales bacterium]